MKSITNVFSAPHSPDRPVGERDDLAPPRPPPTPVLASGPSAWLYFNLLVTQSQIFVPVYDVESAQDMSNLLWSRPEGEAAAQKSGFEQVADMALAFAVLGEVDETGEGAGGWPIAMLRNMVVHQHWILFGSTGGQRSYRLGLFEFFHTVDFGLSKMYTLEMDFLFSRPTKVVWKIFLVFWKCFLRVSHV